MEALYKYDIDDGYGCITNTFVADETEVETLRGKDLYFGEINGKHSEVIIYNVDPDTLFDVVTKDPEKIKMVIDLGLIIGYNPFNYLSEI